MNSLNWKKVIPAVAAVVLCFAVIYVTKRQNPREQIEDDHEENDDEKENKQIPNDSKDDKESYWMEQINALQRELVKAQKQTIQQQDSSLFHVNDKIEINHNGEWRQAVVAEILEAISVSVDGVSGEKQVIIDDTKQIFCDCYDICQVNKYNKSKHRIRCDNKQSKWAKSIKGFLKNRNTANKILKEELNVYAICCKYWKKIKENQNIDIDHFISYHTRKYNEFMMKIASFIKEQDIKKNTRASNYILDHFFGDKQINMNIIYFWRLHMMHPFLYRDDCMKHFGFILSPTFHEYIINIHYYDEKEQELEDIVDTKSMFTEFDFAKSLKKNLVFMGNVLEITKTGTGFKNNFNNDLTDYQNFLYFASYFRNNNKAYNIDLHLCPLMMRDFVWHSHQLFPDQYWRECVLYTDGKIVLDHRDLVPAAQMKQYMAFSQEFWHFAESYKAKLRTNNDGTKKHIAKMIVETESANNHNELLVFGYLRSIDGDRKYPAEIGDYVLKFYADKIKWNKDKLAQKFVNPNARPQNCSGCCM